RMVPGWPVLFWWNDEFRSRYMELPKLESVAPVRNGMSTQNNTRFLRLVWELHPGSIYTGRGEYQRCPLADWALYIKGSEGRVWLEDARDAVRWRHFGLEVKSYNEHLYGSYSRTVKNEQY